MNSNLSLIRDHCAVLDSDRSSISSKTQLTSPNSNILHCANKMCANISEIVVQIPDKSGKIPVIIQ